MSREFDLSDALLPATVFAGITSAMMLQYTPYKYYRNALENSIQELKKREMAGQLRIIPAPVSPGGNRADLQIAYMLMVKK